MLLLTLMRMLVGLVINGVVAIGEEFGWRAYLLPKLMARFASAERASASAEDPEHASGFNATAARKVALLVGVVWSVWPAAVGHGTIFATGSLAVRLLKGSAIPLVGPDPSGLIGGLGYIILALALLAALWPGVLCLLRPAE